MYKWRCGQNFGLNNPGDMLCFPAKNACIPISHDILRFLRAHLEYLQLQPEQCNYNSTWIEITMMNEYFTSKISLC